MLMKEPEEQYVGFGNKMLEIFNPVSTLPLVWTKEILNSKILVPLAVKPGESFT